MPQMPVSPYPEINGLILGHETEASLTADELHPVTSTPGGTKVVGDMGTGKSGDGSFTGPAAVVGNMVTGMPKDDYPNDQQLKALIVGDQVTGRPTDDYSREQNMITEVSPEGLTTGRSKGA